MSAAHTSAAAEHRRSLSIVLALSLGIFVVELVGAALANSLALLADAGHILTDVSGIALALAAIWFAQRPASSARTFGYLRAEILAAAANAVLLLVVGAFVLIEGIRRLSQPPDIEPGVMLVFGLIGLVANGVSVFVLHDAQRHSLNMRGAYLEVLGDVGGSAAVIVAAIVIALTGWAWVDVAASVFIAPAHPAAHVGLLRDATTCSWKRLPRASTWTTCAAHPRCAGRGRLSRPARVDDHLGDERRIGTCGAGQGADAAKALDALSDCLADDFDIEHSTFQIETADRRRLEERSHA